MLGDRLHFFVVFLFDEGYGDTVCAAEGVEVLAVWDDSDESSFDVFVEESYIFANDYVGFSGPIGCHRL